MGPYGASENGRLNYMNINKKLIEFLDDVVIYLAKLSKFRTIQINLKRKLREEIKGAKVSIYERT